MKFGIGQSAPRIEDVRFLIGRGRYVEDLAPPRAPGVQAILTGRKHEADGIAGLGRHTLFPGVHQNTAAAPTPSIAMVVADSREAAQDAAELIDVSYEDLDPVITTAQAPAADAPALRVAATDAGFAKAAHVTRLALHNNRLSANALEMRGAVAEYDPGDRRLTFHASTQAPHTVRGDLAHALGLPEIAVRVTAPDVGGGFGMKGGIYPEDVLVAWAAKRLQWTVRWQAERPESLLADYHGRDQDVEAELAFDAEGRILALRVRSEYNAGAHLSTGGGVSPMFACALATGCYRVPAAHASARAIYTNTSPTQPYRGAGSPH